MGLPDDLAAPPDDVPADGIINLAGLRDKEEKRAPRGYEDAYYGLSTGLSFRG